jgi:hypothetical protein
MELDRSSAARFNAGTARGSTKFRTISDLCFLTHDGFFETADDADLPETDFICCDNPCHPWLNHRQAIKSLPKA